jgi:hypothetical protein
MADATRNPDGTPKRGTSLRKLSKMASVRGLSRDIRNRLRERFGDERPYYNWLIDIAASAVTEPKVRVQAIGMIADRVDGKVATSVELTGAKGGPVKTEDATQRDERPAHERIALALKSLGLLHASGGLAASGEVGGVGSEPASGNAGGPAGDGGGDAAPE